jgi:TolB-like protein/DNA-binding SARP family transcriptional activator/Tfp pilus assembly protein PilF
VHGRFTAARNEADPQSIPISARKGRAILSFLAMQPGYSASRAQLATLLWGDRSDALARQDLRQCLATLRRELATAAPDVLVMEGDEVRLRERSVTVDAAELVALGDSYELSRLERGIALYRGEFLAGSDIDAEAFLDWVAGERSRLETVAARLLERYVEKTDALGDGAMALAAGQRLVALDPLREDRQRLLLRLYARYQGRDAAIGYARALSALLRREADVAPSPATTTLVADIERGAIAPPGPIVVAAGPSLSEAGAPRDSYFLSSVARTKPAIVVLPFDDLTSRPHQGHFARGLATEIAAALSRVKSVAVLADSSIPAGAGKAIDAERIARECGVDYALKGCVRTAGPRTRVAWQLIDACTGSYIWTGRSDHDLSDVFAAQDDIAAKIAASVEPYIYAAEGTRARRQPPHTLDARGCVMRAISLINIRSKRNFAFAEELLKRAIELDPACAQAHSLFAYVMALEVVYGWKSRQSTMVLAHNAAQNAVLLDVDAPWSHLALGYVHAQSRSTDEAIAAYEKALALNPNFGLAHTYLGSALSVLGRCDAALAQIDVAERLGSREIFYGVNNYVRANACFAAGRYRDASRFALKSVRESPGIVTSQRHVVVNCALAGAIEEARKALEGLLRLVPETSLRSIDEALPYVRAQDRVRFLDAFSSVGIE